MLMPSALHRILNLIDDSPTYIRSVVKKQDLIVCIIMVLDSLLAKCTYTRYKSVQFQNAGFAFPVIQLFGSKLRPLHKLLACLRLGKEIRITSKVCAVFARGVDFLMCRE